MVYQSTVRKLYNTIYSHIIPTLDEWIASSRIKVLMEITTTTERNNEYNVTSSKKTIELQEFKNWLLSAYNTYMQDESNFYYMSIACFNSNLPLEITLADINKTTTNYKLYYLCMSEEDAEKLGV